MFNKKLIFFLERQVDMHIVYLKKYKSICHHTTFYSIFNTSSCRKPEIQNHPKQVNLINIFNKQWSKILNYVDFTIFNNYPIDFQK